jgi:hypothetical protein
MPEPELFLIFVRPLNRAGIRNVISGSVLLFSMVNPASLMMWILLCFSTQMTFNG